MSRYDGLIIPRSYSEYINKTDAATIQQALQLSGVLSGAVAAGDNKAVTSNAVKTELTANYYNKQSVDSNFVRVESLNGYTPLYIINIGGDSLKTFIENLSIWIRDNTTNAFIVKGSWINTYHYVSYGCRNAEDLNFVVCIGDDVYTCFYTYGIDRRIFRLQRTQL